MLCEKCKKNEATFYYHENVNGSEKTYSLCKDCANELEKQGEFHSFSHDFNAFFAHDPFESMDNFFGSLFAPQQTRRLAERGGTQAKKCPLCGMTLSDFARDGKVGCPTCYDTFADELEPTVGRIHGRTAHNGHAPTKFREKNEMKNRIRALEAEQKEAIKTENYERAAEIRDELKSLRGNV